MGPCCEDPRKMKHSKPEPTANFMVLPAIFILFHLMIGIHAQASPQAKPGEKPIKIADDVKQIRIEKTRKEYIDPEDFKQAVGLYKQRKYNEALDRFAEMGHKGKNHDQVHYYIGLCCQKLNQLARAKSEFEWVYHNTKSPRLRYNSHVAWFNANKYQNNRTYSGQGNVFARYGNNAPVPPRPKSNGALMGGGGG